MSVKAASENKNRQSNMELCRIVAMLAIVMGHLADQSGALTMDNSVTNWLVAGILGSGAQIANNVFVMIGAWFLVDKAAKPERIVKLYLQLFTYCVPLTLLMIFFNPHGVALKNAVRGLFPFSGSPLWFVTCYIIMLLFSPYLNQVLAHTGTTKTVLLLLFFLCCIPPTFLLRDDFFYTGEAVWFCFLYLLMGTIKQKEADRFSHKKRHWFCYAVTIYLLLVAIRFASDWIIIPNGKVGDIINELSLGTYFLKHFHTLPAFLCSLAVFLGFRDLSMRYNKFINEAAKGCLAVYIIHQTPAFISYLWKEIFHADTFVQSQLFPVWFLGVTVAVFAGGSCCDWLRRKTIGGILENSIMAKKLCLLIQRIYR